MYAEGREGWPSLIKAMMFLLVHAFDVILGDGLALVYGRFLRDQSRGEAEGWRPPTRR